MSIYRLINHTTKSVVSQFTAESDAEANEVASLYYLERGIRAVAKKQTDTYKVLVCMQHALSENQLASITNCIYMDKPIEVVYLKDVDADLFASVSSIKFGDNLELYADQLHDLIKCGGYLAVILPIGSPAFMARFTMKKPDGLSMLFSHSDRMAVDNPDGTKTTKFVHSGWVGVDDSSYKIAWMLNGNSLIFR